MDFPDYRREAVRYWERRRIAWNIILIPPSVLAYMFASGLAAGIGDPGQFGMPVVAALFCFSAFGANVCYSFAYVIEFWVAGRDVEGSYRSSGRPLVFTLGCLLGVGLALAKGQHIAILQYPV